MSVTPEDNRLMTLVEGDAPLGNMLREFYWLPAVPSSAIVADGKPFRLRIVGGNYVVFRDTSGRVGVLDGVGHRGRHGVRTPCAMTLG